MTILAHDFMTKICKKAAQLFHCTVSKVFDRVKSVALWAANIRKLAKDYKGYGSAASQTSEYEIGVGCFSNKHATLSRKSKDWSTWNPENVFDWSDMSNHLIQSGHDYHLIECNLFSL